MNNNNTTTDAFRDECSAMRKREDVLMPRLVVDRERCARSMVHEA